MACIEDNKNEDKRDRESFFQLVNDNEEGMSLVFHAARQTGTLG